MSELNDILKQLDDDDKFEVYRYAVILLQCQRAGVPYPKAWQWEAMSPRTKRYFERKIHKIIMSI